MFNSWKRIISVVLLLLTTVNLMGCEVVDKTVKILVDEDTPANQGEAAQEETKGETPRQIELTTPEAQNNTRETELTTKDPDAQASGTKESETKTPQWGSSASRADNSKTNAGVENQQIKLVLYFANNQGTGLVYQQRTTNKVTGLAKRAIEELIKGPEPTAKAVTAIPKGTKLLDLNIKADGLAIANFSMELKENHGGGSTGEALTVYSIVNTLCQFPTVKHVQILIEGQKVDSLAGHLDLSVPLERDVQIVKAE